MAKPEKYSITWTTVAEYPQRPETSQEDFYCSSVAEAYAVIVSSVETLFEGERSITEALQDNTWIISHWDVRNDCPGETYVEVKLVEQDDDDEDDS
jgi:hypothetical protein